MNEEGSLWAPNHHKYLPVILGGTVVLWYYCCEWLIRNHILFPSRDCGQGKLNIVRH